MGELEGMACPWRLLLALAAALVNSSLFVQVAPSIGFYYVAVFAAGLLLAWRSIPAAFCFPCWFCCSRIARSPSSPMDRFKLETFSPDLDAPP